MEYKSHPQLRSEEAKPNGSRKIFSFIADSVPHYVLEIPLRLLRITGVVGRILGKNRGSEGQALPGLFGHSYTALAAATPARKPAFLGACLRQADEGPPKQGRF